MFTGIIEGIGKIQGIRKGKHSAEVVVHADTVLEDIHLGESIAVNGVCLTVVSFSQSSFTADVMHETLKRSSLGSLRTGSPVNLERAMSVNGSLTDEPVRTATYAAVQRAKKAGAIISYDPNYRASLWSSREEAVLRMREPLPLMDVMKLSDEETELLSGYRDPEKAAKELSDRGIGLIAVTLGKAGALVCREGECRMIPGYDLPATDTTGAGDAFWGGFLCQLLKSGKPLEAVNLEDAASFARFGNATATICVSRRGGIPAMPTLQEVIRLMQR